MLAGWMMRPRECLLSQSQSLDTWFENAEDKQMLELGVCSTSLVSERLSTQIFTHSRKGNAKQ